MATWPSGTKASTANLDAGTDKPSLARPDIKQNVDNVNSIIDMFNITSPSDGQILKYNLSNTRFELATDESGSGGITEISGGTDITVDQLSTGGVIISYSGSALQNVVEDTTPQLGGALDGQGNKIENIELDDYKETVYTSGSTTGTITPDVANGNVQKITLTGNITLNALGNPEAGQSMTLIVIQPGSGGPYTLTSSMKFAGAEKTLSTAADAIDIISIFYDGTTYYASLAKGFA